MDTQIENIIELFSQMWNKIHQSYLKARQERTRQSTTKKRKRESEEAGLPPTKKFKIKEVDF